MPAAVLTPYVTPSMLLAAPTGIAWKSIPGGANNQPSNNQNLAELLNICWRATSMVETEMAQQARATLITEQLYGPDFWLTLPNGIGQPARMYTRRWPVLKIVGGQISPASTFPRSWTTIAANQFDVDYTVHGDLSTISQAPDTGLSPNPISIAPGYISWLNGRRGIVLNISYIAGWPTCGLTANAAANATTLTVDDVTGFDVAGDPTPIRAVIYDDDLTEDIQIVGATATAPVTTAQGFTVNSGPGTLTLKNGLLNTHNRFNNLSPTLVTTLPEQIQWATILFCSSIAVTRGATASTVQQMPGTHGRSGAVSADYFRNAAKDLLAKYKHAV